MTSFQVSQDQIFEGDNGICLACGAIQYGGIEPDARQYNCDVCGQPHVYGLEEAVLLGRVIPSYDGDE